MKFYNMGGNQSKQNEIPAIIEPQISHETGVQDMGENIRFPNISSDLNDQQLGFIKEHCKNISFFKDLSEDNINKLIQKFKVCLSVDEWLFKQGSNATHFFIIAEGHVEIVKNGYLIRSLGPGDCFGQIALLYGIKRSSSVRVVKQFRTKNVYYALHKKYLLQATQRQNREKTTQFLQLVSQCVTFDYLTIREKCNLAQSAIKINFHKNQRILTKYDQPYALFLISSGQVDLKFPNSRCVRIGTKSMFGFYGSNQIQCSASAVDGTVVYAIGRNIVTRILGTKIKYLYFWNKVKYTLLGSPFMLSLDQQRINNITSMFTFHSVNQTTPICRCQAPVTKLFISIPNFSNISGHTNDCVGICWDQGDTKQRKYRTNQVIGLKEVINGNKKYSRDFVGTKMYNYAQIQSELLLKYMDDLDFNVNKEQVQSFNFSKSQVVHSYPRGATLAEQIICKQHRYGLYYLLETCQKSNESKLQQLRSVYSILQTLCSPFLESIYMTHEKQTQLVCIKEFIRGIYVQDIMRKIGTLPYSISKFYLTCLVSTFAHLEEEHIAVSSHFSLQNCKVNELGYLCLLGVQVIRVQNYTTKEFKYAKNNQKQSYSQKRTIAQLKARRQYTFNFRCMGFLAYEIFIGTPLRQQQNQSWELEFREQQTFIEFPNSFKQKQAKQLVQTLINAPYQQLTWEKIKQMSFFKGVDWRLLAKKQIQAPVIPGLLSMTSRQF